MGVHSLRPASGRFIFQRYKWNPVKGIMLPEGYWRPARGNGVRGTVRGLEKPVELSLRIDDSVKSGSSGYVQELRTELVVQAVPDKLTLLSELPGFVVLMVPVAANCQDGRVEEIEARDRLAAELNQANIDVFLAALRKNFHVVAFDFGRKGQRPPNFAIGLPLAA